MNLKMLVAFVLVGCGGESFTGFGSTAKNDDDGGLGGAPTEIDAGGDVGGSAGTGGASGGSSSSGGTASGGASTGGAPASTGGSATGGASTGGVSGSGGVPIATGGTVGSTGGAPISTGGTPSSGGMSGTGGSVVCTLVTHDNGIGQTWQDCAPLGTYNENQATKACTAYTGDAKKCTPVGSVGCGALVQGTDTTTYNDFWAYSGSSAGYVGVMQGCPSSTNGKHWN